MFTKQCSHGKLNNVILINKSALIASVAEAARRDSQWHRFRSGLLSSNGVETRLDSMPCFLVGKMKLSVQSLHARALHK